MIINGDHCISLTITEYHWLSLNINEYQWTSMNINELLLTTINEYWCILMNNDGHQGISTNVKQNI